MSDQEGALSEEYSSEIESEPELLSLPLTKRARLSSSQVRSFLDNSQDVRLLKTPTPIPRSKSVTPRVSRQTPTSTKKKTTSQSAGAVERHLGLGGSGSSTPNRTTSHRFDENGDLQHEDPILHRPRSQSAKRSTSGVERRHRFDENGDLQHEDPILHRPRSQSARRNTSGGETGESGANHTYLGFDEDETGDLQQDDHQQDDHIYPPQTPESLSGQEEQNSTGTAILGALKELTNKVNNAVDRIENMERTLRTQNSSVSSTSASETAAKRRKSRGSIPLVVRSELRKTYKLLLEDEENEFGGFDFDPSVPFNSATNEAVVSTLCREIMANNPQFQACDIKAAAYTYYRTKSQEESLKQRGMHAERNRSRRRRERLLRKLHERTSIFEKADMQPKAKEKWKKVLTPDFISSEESASDNDDVFVKSIPWRSTLVSNFFEELDKKSKEKKTSQANRQRKARRLSIHPSSRSIPQGLPAWAVSKN